MVPQELFSTVFPPMDVGARRQIHSRIAQPVDLQFPVLTVAMVLMPIGMFLSLLNSILGQLPPLLLLGSVISIGAWITWMIFHYTIWSLVPREFAETTPGKAVGFLFIPFSIFTGFSFLFQGCIVV